MAGEDRRERAEAAAIRRRWLTLGEILAVAAVAISGLTLWNSWSERRATEAEKIGAEQKAAVAAGALALGGAATSDGRRLAIAALRDDQRIQGQTVMFPPALRMAAVETTGEPRLEAQWIEKSLRKAVEDASAPGDRRLPVLLITRFLVDGEMRTDRAFYDVGYRFEGGGLLDDRDVRLIGLSVIGPAPAESAPARLDALWTKRR